MPRPATGYGTARESDTDDSRRYGFCNHILKEPSCSRPRAPSKPTVSYTLTGLSETGNRAIAAFCGEAYIEMIEEWRTLIELRCLS